MGGVKQMMLEAQQMGFDIDNRINVCTECFGNEAIKEFISNHDAGSECSYCSWQENPSCSLEIVLKHIMSCIRMEWGNPQDEGLTYITDEGGWQGSVYDSCVLIDYILDVEINSHELREDIMSSLMDDAWCKRDPYSFSDNERLLYGWRSFSKFVMFEARYVFLNATPSTYDKHQHDEIHPVKILESLADFTRELNLIELCGKEKAIFRARIVDDKCSLCSAKELGPPPATLATIPNRMSPVGIPMFYCAFDKLTAVKETYDPQKSTGKKAICGVFHPTRDLVLLNLSKPLNIPDLFDEKLNMKRPIIKFLIDFIADFSKPIARDDRSHIEYVPTQIVTEYFKHIFRGNKNEKLDGIIYPSSKEKGHSSVVIFADQLQCADKATEYKKETILFLERIEELDLKNEVTAFG